MESSVRLLLACTCLAACSNAPRSDSAGQFLVVLTIDWEGAYLSPDGLDALDAVRTALPGVPLTHFVSAAYLTKEAPDAGTRKTFADEIRPGDEAALHLHVWRSLAVAAGIEPKVSPSFLSGTDKIFEFDDGDSGFDTDLDVYSAGEIRKLVQTSRKLLESNGVTVAPVFRAGGFLSTPRVLQAIRDEGYTVDSSAIAPAQVKEAGGEVFGARVGEVWPDVTSASQPFTVALRGGSLIELPIAAFADYVPTTELVSIVRQAHAALERDPAHDVVVVFGFHQETADEFGPRIREALTTVRSDAALADDLAFVTVDEAVARVRSRVQPRKRP